MKLNKWSIWRANLDPVIGSEQGKSRPVLIISEDDINALLNIVNIIPITSRKPGRIIYPNEEFAITLEKETQFALIT
jgi:mRNA interferase MazF